MTSTPKRSVGRPRRQPKSAHELQQQARENIRRTQERQLGREVMDVGEICEKVDEITLKHKYTKEEMDLLRRKVDLRYHEYVLDRWQDEEQQMSRYAESLFALALEDETKTPCKQMSEADWNRMHGLRKDGKGLKPGPSKRKPKSVFDMELVPGEPIDFEELETQWMEEQILNKKNEQLQLKGKRMRGDAVNAVTPRAEDKSFWY
ncbi:MAG: hypothetical protein GWP23_00070 [Synechococcales cyanobacterium H12SWP_bin.12]|nr:hypothetical protein [Synechococcales cyanobacterium H12SWP_bin.12]